MQKNCFGHLLSRLEKKLPKKSNWILKHFWDSTGPFLYFVAENYIKKSKPHKHF